MTVSELITCMITNEDPVTINEKMKTQEKYKFIYRTYKKKLKESGRALNGIYFIQSYTSCVLMPLSALISLNCLPVPYFISG